MKHRPRAPRRLSRRRSSAAITAALLLGLAACGGDTATSTSGSGADAADVEDFGLGADVLEAAREEGELSYVGSTLQAETGERIQTIMRDTYGIEVTITPLRAAETLERLRTEERAGNRTIDVVGLGVQYGAVMKEEGLSEAFQPEGFPEFFVDAAEYDEEGYWYPFQLTLYGVAVNSAQMDPSDISSWDSLADGSVSEPMVIADPSIGSGGFTWSVAMQEDAEFGPDYLEELGGQDNLQLGPVHADNVARLARGDVAAYFPFGAFSLAELQGSAADDVELVYPGGIPYVGPINLSLTKDAPHHNAAQVFMSFLMSEEGQTLIAEGGQTPTRTDIEVPDERYHLATYDRVIETNLEAVLENHENVEEFSQQYFGGAGN